MARNASLFPRLHWIFLAIGSLLGCSSQTPDLVFLDAREKSVSVTLTADGDGDDYWIIPYSTQVPRRGSGVFVADRNRNSSLRDRMSARLSAEGTRRIQTQDRLRALASRPATASLSYRALGDSDPDRIEIHSPFSSDGSATIQGVRKASNDDANVYVDSRYADQITASSAREILRRFSMISLPRLRSLFGDPTDIDGNRRVDLFFSSEDKIGSGVVGFFRPADLLPGQSDGNEREIVYVQLPDPALPTEFYDATVAHETFHLIHFGEKTLRLLWASRGRAYIEEEVFLSEGLAHLAEELTGFGLCSVIIAQDYLHCVDRTSLAGSGVRDATPCSTVFEDDSLARRGGDMLLLLRLVQEQGGLRYSEDAAAGIEGSARAFLRALVGSERTGLQNLEYASGRGFYEIYGDFVATLALDGTPHPLADRFSFGPIRIDPFTHLPRGLSVRMTRTDPAMLTFRLDGPALSDGLFEDTASLIRTGARFYTLRVAPGASQTLSFKDEGALGLGIAIVRITP